MSFQNINIQGEVSSEQTKTIVKVDADDNVLSEQEVQVTKGEISQITLECDGDTITLRGLITQVQKSYGAKAVGSFEVQEPGKATYNVTSLESERVTRDGVDVRVPADTVVTPVLTGKAF